MGRFDTLFRKQAKKTVALFSTASHTVLRKGAYVPEDDVEGAATLYPIKGAVVDYSSKDINGTSILRGDVKLLVPFLDLPSGMNGDFIESKDYILLDGVEKPEWRIVTVGRTRGVDLIALFELQLRKAE